MQGRVQKAIESNVTPTTHAINRKIPSCSTRYSKHNKPRKRETHAREKHLFACHRLLDTKLLEPEFYQRVGPAPRYGSRERKHSHPQRPLKNTSLFNFHKPKSRNGSNLLEIFQIIETGFQFTPFNFVNNFHHTVVHGCGATHLTAKFRHRAIYGIHLGKLAFFKIL